MHALERCSHPPVRRGEFGGRDADAAAGPDLDVDDGAAMDEVLVEIFVYSRRRQLQVKDRNPR